MNVLWVSPLQCLKCWITSLYYLKVRMEFLKNKGKLERFRSSMCKTLSSFTEKSGENLHISTQFIKFLPKYVQKHVILTMNLSIKTLRTLSVWLLVSMANTTCLEEYGQYLLFAVYQIMSIFHNVHILTQFQVLLSDLEPGKIMYLFSSSSK